ncbi:MAG TPA: hypothetical protein VM933_07225, partial [Acidimicrobiales bacterium]|nr:hypothetical protein [Acidimicrobiales bacterium]
ADPPGGGDGDGQPGAPDAPTPGGGGAPTGAGSGPSSLPEEPSQGILSISATEGLVYFQTVRPQASGASVACPDDRIWRAPRIHPGAVLAVTAGLDRLVELQPDTGAVLAELARWDPRTATATGAGVALVGAGRAPAISTDGRKLAFAADRHPAQDTSCAPDVVVRDLVTGSEKVLAAARGSHSDGRGAVDRVARLRWSPDGATLALTLSHEGEWTVLAEPSRDASQAQGRRVLAGADGWAPFDVDWLADGRIVLGSSCCYPDHEQQGQLAVVGADGVPQPLAEAGEGAQQLDVDRTGAHLLYVRRAGAGPFEVVVRRDLGAAAVVASGYAAVAW